MAAETVKKQNRQALPQLEGQSEDEPRWPSSDLRRGIEKRFAWLSLPPKKLNFQSKQTPFPLLLTAAELKTLTDSDLIRRYLASQNQVWFSQLYWRYASKVFAKCISLLRDEPMARDATQDIFIKILLNLAKFNEQSSFSTWVYSITYNYCIDLIRKRKKEAIIFTEDMGKVSPVKEEQEIPDGVLLEMKTEHLKAVLDRLPSGDRAILLMKYQDDMSIKEIADAFEKTESAIKMQIMRAKAKSAAIYEDLYKGSLDAAEAWLGEKPQK